MRIVSLLAICSYLALTVSCQKEEATPIEHSSIVAALEANLGKPYFCTIRSVSRFQITDSGTIGQIELESQFLYAKEESSYSRREISAKGFPTLTSFMRRESGLEHTVQQSMPGVPEDWACDLWEQGEYPLGAEGVFPRGGWSVLAQIDKLIQVFGETQATSSGDIVEMKWIEIPLSVREDMLSQLGIYGRGSNQKEEVRLAINLAEGTPVSLEVYLGEGESVVYTFATFDFAEKDNQVLAKQLEEGASIPEAFQCKCDYSSPHKRVLSREAVPD